LQVPGSTLLVDEAGFRFYTAGVYHVWSRDYRTVGPKSAAAQLPDLPVSILNAGPQSGHFPSL